MVIVNGLEFTSNQIREAAAYLKQNGFFINTIHFRPVAFNHGGSLHFSNLPMFEVRRLGLSQFLIAKGGYTTVRFIRIERANNVATKPRSRKIDVTEEAVCSKEDNFIPRLGYERAFVRAYNSLSKLVALPALNSFNAFEAKE